MRVAYLNLVLIDGSLAGVSGDKLLSAFASASGKSKELEAAINNALRGIGRKDTEVFFEETESHGIRGLQLSVSNPVSDDRGRSGAKTADEVFETLNAALEAIGLSQAGKKRAWSTMELLIGIERAIHGTEILHELGSADTVVDIVGTFKAIELLGIEKSNFFTTPIAVGSGAVFSSHGMLPVPAPATLSIMSRARLPMVRTEVHQELTTPTGAALLAILTAGRANPPPFRTTPASVGVGIGRRELGFPNITRIIMGESLEGTTEEEILMVETNVDDVDGEVLGWLFEKLSGLAEDVCIIPMLTKKNRPGHLIRAVTTATSVGKVIDTILEETGTLGVKVSTWSRVKVAREENLVDVNIKGKLHSIRVKTNLRTGARKPAYEDCRKIASEEGMPLKSVVDMVRMKLQTKEKGDE